MQTADEVIEWIHSLLPFGIKPGLKRMEWLLQRLDHPERELAVVHIGGTNGKGSTVSFMRHVLERAHYNVGTFTSPYLECFEERVSVNGQPIAGSQLVACANKLRPLVDELAETDLGSPTEFEVITALAFDYFARIAKPDIVLLEVGLGGRLDSTNVVTPLLSIITSIGYDHMHILGESLAEITYEKAGIIKQHCPVISGVSQPEAQAIIKRTADERQSEYEQLGLTFTEELLSVKEEEQCFLFQRKNSTSMEVKIQMAGAHQRSNAAVAIAALQKLSDQFDYSISEQALKEGLAQAKWNGRFERLSDNPLVIVDGAHNKEGFESLAETLKQHYPQKRYKVLLAATKEKDMKSLLSPFAGLDAAFTFTSFDFFRAAAAKSLYEQAEVTPKRYNEKWRQAVADELRLLAADELLLICGSLYFISAVRAAWKETGFPAEEERC
ncbi:bifunctional folylpolyglutamate synthase/dihydrofolate synthase [Alkalihalobacillus oceani]|uniref:bifunctional folylpolyglutamate synthase/dihydrofolate synthase n=1 Tax=Halalkalibacter oceani TaxID=1653776 RepID=UPI00203CF445|nr:folylpolyglutamate synthase/dihydrofolate synthase family protein [Halalkalibacter oceani]MCM3759764.1 bifunctional folylpolyglutamate synthase/dihydrofolate synthase [Halalkalibacter oceani]